MGLPLPEHVPSEPVALMEDEILLTERLRGSPTRPLLRCMAALDSFKNLAPLGRFNGLRHQFEETAPSRAQSECCENAAGGALCGRPPTAPTQSSSGLSRCHRPDQHRIMMLARKGPTPEQRHRCSLLRIG